MNSRRKLNQIELDNIELLERKVHQYRRLCEQHVRNLQKKNDEIWKLKAQLAEAEKFNKMQD